MRYAADAGLQVRAAELQVKSAKASRLPTLGLRVGDGQSGNSPSRVLLFGRTAPKTAIRAAAIDRSVRPKAGCDELDYVSGVETKQRIPALRNVRR